MKINKIEKKGFKTCEVAMFLTLPLDKTKMSMQALIPEVLKRGSKNFVKPRFEYKEDKEKLLELRKQLNYKVGE